MAALRCCARSTGASDYCAASPQCFLDRRDPLRIEHSVAEMVSQRVYGLALGYEDLNDHEQLRHDPLLAAAGRQARVGLAAGGQEHAEPVGVVASR